MSGPAPTGGRPAGIPAGRPPSCRAPSAWSAATRGTTGPGGAPDLPRGPGRPEARADAPRRPVFSGARELLRYL